MDNTVLRVAGLVKDYGAYRAVDHVGFEIRRGQVLGLLGPNGAGKTTTIQILVGITNHTSGKIAYFGKNFLSHRQESLQRINFTSAYNTLLGRISVTENLMTFARLYQIPNKREKVAELLDKFEIGHLANQHYIDLSAGERTRVNLAKSLLNDPELILMDEPTASLDPDIADKTLTWIEELRRDRNLAILYTSHDMDEVERICDRVIFLDHGKIVSEGSPADHTGKLGQVEITLTFKGPQEEIVKLLDTKGYAYSFPEKNVVIIEGKQDDSARVIAEIFNSGVKITDTEIKKPDLEQVFLEIARSRK